jgi:integrase
VDFDRNLLSVTHSKTAEGEHRPVPLTARVRAMLDAHRKASGLIFTYEGHPISRPKTGWTAALRRAGLPHYRLHDLRQHADFLIMPTRYSKPALVAPETHWESA